MTSWRNLEESLGNIRETFWKSGRKSWEIYLNYWGNLREIMGNMWKIRRKSWGNHDKILGKLLENIGEIFGISWECLRDFFGAV